MLHTFYSALFEKKTLWIIFSRFFLKFWLKFLSMNRLYKNATFLKKIEKIHLKSKILRWFFCFWIFVGDAVSYSHPWKIFIRYDFHYFRWLLKTECLKNLHLLLRYQSFHYQPFSFFPHRQRRAGLLVNIHKKTICLPWTNLPIG